MSRAPGALLTVALTVASLVASACGGNTASGTSPAAAGASADYTNGLRYARCMRQHGVPRFPDPSNPGGFSTQALALLDTAAPQFTKATATCQRSLPNDGQLTPAELEQTVKNGLKFARCMRAHGVQHFSDPGISGTHLVINLADVNTNSPQYLAAGHACAVVPGS